MMVVVQGVPCKVIEEALDAFRSAKEIPEDYSMSIEETNEEWSFLFLPINHRWRGGDVGVRIAKDTLDVLEVVQYQ